MTLSRTSSNTAAVQNNVHSETHLIKLHFPTVVRWSSGARVLDSASDYFEPHSIASVSTDGITGTLSFLDEDGSFAQQLLGTGSSDTRVQIWTLYTDPAKKIPIQLISGQNLTTLSGQTLHLLEGRTKDSADPIFDGRLGSGSRDDKGVWRYRLIESEIRRFPDDLVLYANGFGHLPPSPLRIETSNGIVELIRG